MSGKGKGALERPEGKVMFRGPVGDMKYMTSS